MILVYLLLKGISMELYLSDAIIEAKGGLDAATKIVDK
jgi:hypothetical protein